MDTDRLPPSAVPAGPDSGGADGRDPLRDSEARFRSLSLLSSHWYWEQDEQFRFTSFEGAQQSSTWRPDPTLLLGRTRWDIDWLRPLEGTWDEHRAQLRAHRPFRDFRCLNLRFPETPVYLSSSGDPVFEGGRFAGYRGTTRDVTASVLAEQDRHSTQAFLRIAARMGRLGAWAYRAGDGRVTWSDELCALYKVEPGYSPTPQQVIAAFAPEHRDLVAAKFTACLREGVPFDVEAMTITSSGRTRWLRVIGEAERDADGAVRRIQGACQDVTVAQQELLRLNAQLEGRVRERTAQLEAANRELEAFSYAIAHDLRAPLAAIEGFSDCLEREAGAQLAGRNLHYLRRIRAGVAHMRDLTGGLLSLASLSRAGLRSKPVDLALLAQAVVAGLREHAPQRQVDVVIAADLPARGDPQLLAQALDNLVGNAWKFTSRCEHARIEVGSAPQPAGGVVYFVRDNGAGFDPAWSAKLFEPFQRLHTQEEFEGTGIGLAIVHKVIALHGGRIWAESAPGQGATFFFTLG